MCAAMSLGIAMFGKALVLGAWVFIVSRWDAYRQRRMARGLSLKQNRQGVYEVSDWTLKVNRAARVFAISMMTLSAVWSLTLLAIVLIGGREAGTRFITWLLFS